jgi:Ca2+-binding EF-hand superfamily protein
MKSFSNGIFVALLLVLILPFGGKDLRAQSDDKEKSSQPESQSSALEADSDSEGLLRLMDADQDSFVTEAEWQRIFAQYDQNGDNLLSKNEIESIPVEGRGEEELDPNQGRLAAFERLDVNRNNGIDSVEWPGKDEDFGYLDANQNGSLSRVEFLSRNGRFWNQPFENLDFDANGIIVRSEWLDSEESFDRLDNDRNGMVERREFYNPR